MALQMTMIQNVMKWDDNHTVCAGANEILGGCYTGQTPCTIWKVHQIIRPAFLLSHHRTKWTWGDLTLLQPASHKKGPYNIVQFKLPLYPLGV